MGKWFFTFVLFLSFAGCTDNEFKGSERKTPKETPRPVGMPAPTEEPELEEPEEEEEIPDSIIDALLSCLPIEPPDDETVRLGCSVIVQPDDAEKSDLDDWIWGATVGGDDVEFDLDESDEKEFEVEIDFSADDIEPAVKLTVKLEINGEKYHLSNRYEPN